MQHNLLLKKLADLQVSEQSFLWLAECLRNRTQQVIYGGSASDVTPVTSGVIQESSLGTCLFVAFMNDLQSKLKTCKLYLFTDDSKMAGSAKSETKCALIKADLNAIGE